MEDADGRIFGYFIIGSIYVMARQTSFKVLL